MNNKILKGCFALGCLTLALFSVVKTEGEKKKPIIMRQMAAAEEAVDDDYQTLAINSEEASEKIEAADDKEESERGAVDEKIDYTQATIEYENDEDLSICVFGKAHLSVAPDCAVIYGRIETLENDMALSKENNFASFDKIVASLTEKGFKKDNVKLEFFGCSPSYDYSSGKSLNGYYSTTSFSVCLPEIDKIEQCLTILTENGATSIDNISYKVSDIESQYNQTLAAAIENAKQKAEKLAGDGLSLVKVREECVYCSNGVSRAFAEGFKPTDFVGNVEIEARVQAIFEK